MNYKFRRFSVLVIVCFCLLLTVPGLAESKLPKGKQTELGLYVTAQEAYAKWLKDSDTVKIVDVRTPEEYSFIGHPPMAHNIPFMILPNQWYKAGNKAWALNPDFISQIKKKFNPTDTLVLMCRSGGRSARAVNALAKEGFKNVYTVTDGFEGGKVKDENSYFNGKRFLNGWRNSGSPWTYKVDPKLAFGSVLEGAPDHTK